MLKDGTPDGTLPSYFDGFVLVFNEPSIEGIPPDEGAQRYLMLRDLYEDAKFVVGGAVEANTEWAIEFLGYLEDDEYPERWHVHHYFANSIEQAVADIRSFHELVDRPLWVTEFGSTNGNETATSSFMLFMETTAWIEYYAYFPTRMLQASAGGFDWFPPHWLPEMALIDWHSGELMPMGEMYRDFEVTTLIFPKVEHGGK
jgi:hypothetical protein